MRRYALRSIHAQAEPLAPAGPPWKKVKSEVSEAFSAEIPETPESCGPSEEPSSKKKPGSPGRLCRRSSQDEGVKSEAVEGANSNNDPWDDQDWQDWHVDQPEDAPGLDCKAFHATLPTTRALFLLMYMTIKHMKRKDRDEAF